MTQRDFRTYYYFQLGMKGVNQKNIESLLNESVVDVQKLKEFCTRTKIPAHNRCILWKVLTGVYSQFRESWFFVSEQLREQFTDLDETVTAIDPFVPSKQNLDSTQIQCEKLHHLLMIDRHFIETDPNVRSNQQVSMQDEQQEREYFLAMIHVFYTVCSQATPIDSAPTNKIEPDADAYWLFSTFITKQFGPNTATWRSSVLWLVNELRRLISANEQQIHVQVISPYKNEVDEIFTNWFSSLFASCLPIQITLR
jgi:hypothetical protein